MSCSSVLKHNAVFWHELECKCDADLYYARLLLGPNHQLLFVSFKRSYQANFACLQVSAFLKKQPCRRPRRRPSQERALQCCPTFFIRTSLWSHWAGSNFTPWFCILRSPCLSSGNSTAELSLPICQLWEMRLDCHREPSEPFLVLVDFALKGCCPT